MNQAESCMSSQPDSALAILQDLSAAYPQLPSGARARHALLLSMAKDKCYIDETNDSLARIAYNYYRFHGSKRNRMLSTYYLAYVEFCAQQSVEAIVLFKEAEILAQELGDYHYLGFTQQWLAELCSQNYDHDAFRDYSERAIHSFSLSRDSLPADLCRIYIADYLRIRDQYSNASAIVDSLLQNRNVNPLIEGLATVVKGDICYAQKQWSQADALYAASGDMSFTPSVRIKGNRAIIQEHLNQPRAADSLMSIARQQILSPKDSTIYYDCAKELFLLRNNYKDAYFAADSAATFQNKAVSALLARSATHAEKAFWEENYFHEQTRRRNLAFTATVITLSLIICILIIVLILRKKELQLASERDAAEALKKDLLLLQKEQKASGTVLNTLLQDKIDRIQQLSGTYFNWTDEAVSLREELQGKAMKEEVIVAFRKELRELRNDPHLASDIENALDQGRQNLMKRLRQMVFQTPGMHFSDTEYKLITFFFASFSSKTISFLMDMTDDAVRKRKSRIKKVFMEHGEPFSEFVKLLS